MDVVCTMIRSSSNGNSSRKRNECWQHHTMMMMMMMMTMMRMENEEWLPHVVKLNGNLERVVLTPLLHYHHLDLNLNLDPQRHHHDTTTSLELNMNTPSVLPTKGSESLDSAWLISTWLSLHLPHPQSYGTFSTHEDDHMDDNGERSLDRRDRTVQETGRDGTGRDGT